MRIVLLKACSYPEHLIFVPSGKSDDVHNLWRCHGKSSCLIKNDGVCRCYGFQEFAALNRKVIVLTLPHCRKNCDRHREL